MIYIKNADRFDPANGDNIGMITSPKSWSADWDGVSYKALSNGGFIAQSQTENHFVIVSEGAIKLMNMDYGR